MFLIKKLVLQVLRFLSDHIVASETVEGNKENTAQNTFIKILFPQKISCMLKKLYYQPKSIL